MRILHIASGDFFSTYGGGQVYVKNVVECMIAKGIDVTVISTVGDISAPIKKDYKGIDLYEIPDNLPDDDYSKLIQSINPDIIHAHSRKAQTCRVGTALDIPVVVTSHHGGILCPAGTRMNQKDEICNCKLSHKDCLPCVLRNTRTGLKWWYPIMRHLPEKSYIRLGEFLKTKPFILFVTPIGSAARHIVEKQKEWAEIADKCTAMIAPCDAVSEAMTQNGLSRQKVHILPHGIPLPDNRPAFPEIKDDKIKFYYVGRIAYIKGIHILAEAFHRVNNPDIELHIIGGAGNNKFDAYHSSLINKYRNDKRIVWHGKIPHEQVYEMTSEFHVSCSVPIYLEIFGLNIAEALALGKPVLASRCGGAEMQIEDGKNGWLVDPNNIEQLAEKIRHIADNPSQLSHMSDNCHATSIEEHAEKLLRLYNQESARFAKISR